MWPPGRHPSAYLGLRTACQCHALRLSRSCGANKEAGGKGDSLANWLALHGRAANSLSYTHTHMRTNTHVQTLHTQDSHAIPLHYTLPATVTFWESFSSFLSTSISTSLVSSLQSISFSLISLFLFPPFFLSFSFHNYLTFSLSIDISLLLTLTFCLLSLLPSVLLCPPQETVRASWVRY